MRKWLGLLLLSAATCVACLTAYTQPPPAPQARSTDPRVRREGET